MRHFAGIGAALALVGSEMEPTSWRAKKRPEMADPKKAAKRKAQKRARRITRNAKR